MKTAVLIFLVCTTVICQETYSTDDQNVHNPENRVSSSYTTSVIHNDPKDGKKNAQSIINVNFNPNAEHQQNHQKKQKPIAYSQPDPRPGRQAVEYQDKDQTSQSPSLHYQSGKTSEQQPLVVYQSVTQSPDQTNDGFYYQPFQQQSPTLIMQYQEKPQVPNQGQYQPYVHLAPQPSYNQKELQPQLYNVGYSINIANSAPKLSYRLPNPPNVHSYRQQKLLNADVITGINKDKVEKPMYVQQNHNLRNTPLLPNNYLAIDQAKAAQSIFGHRDVQNTHRYTWKTLSPGVEIAGYHNLNEPLSHNQQVQAQNFDHSAALGRSQGFDISNVVENKHKPAQPITDQTQSTITQSYLKSEANVENKPIASALKAENPQGSYDSDLYNFQNSAGAFHNLIPASNIEFDKTLFDNFYKNYKPAFYNPSVTLPAPKLPATVLGDFHHAASNQFPNYNHPLPFKSLPYQPDPRMTPQFAYVQPEGFNTQNSHSLNLAQSFGENVKPVKEALEDHQVQQTQHQFIINVKDPILEKLKGISTHKKYFSSPKPTHLRPYGTRAVMYGNDKNYRLKTDLRPPPMVIVHQKY